MGWLGVVHGWDHGIGWTSPSLSWEPQRTSPGGMDSDRSVSDWDSKAFLGGVEWCMVCSSHWRPLGVWLTWVAYLPGNWTGHCTWGWPYLPACVQKTLIRQPTNWQAFEVQHWVKCTPWWYYPLVVFSPQAASIVTETEISALALHTAHALNATHDSWNLLHEEVCQLRKVALQNHIVLNMLTASQGGVCALVGTECCVYDPDVYYIVSQALRVLVSVTCATEGLTGDPLQEWWAPLTTEWQWVLAVLSISTCVLLTCCCSLYCCCGLWLQGFALLSKGTLQKTSSHRLFSEKLRSGGL